MAKKIKILNKNESAEIWLYEDIGSSWFGGVTAKDFAEEMKAIKNAKQITVYINSPGGDVFDGISIYNQIRRHPAEVTVEIDGVAASIASLIAMSGDRIIMAENATMMIHKPWGGSFGTADEMRKYADTLDMVEDQIADTYTKRTGTAKEVVAQLMADETWMKSDQALQYGFIDEISEPKQMAAYVNLKKYNYKNLPNDLPSAVYTVQPEKKVFPIRTKYEEMIKKQVVLVT